MPKKNGKLSNHPSAVKSRHYKNRKPTANGEGLDFPTTGRPRKVPARAVGVTITVNLAGVHEAVKRLTLLGTGIECRADAGAMDEAANEAIAQLQKLKGELNEALTFLPVEDEEAPKAVEAAPEDDFLDDEDNEPADAEAA